jgi:hypothetical protein
MCVKAFFVGGFELNYASRISSLSASRVFITIRIFVIAFSQGQVMLLRDYAYNMKVAFGSLEQGHEHNRGQYLTLHHIVINEGQASLRWSGASIAT